jgi:2-phospho-L-lactate/phosphoenolpyruvate guanylyltransferase
MSNCCNAWRTLQARLRDERDFEVRARAVLSVRESAMSLIAMPSEEPSRDRRRACALIPIKRRASCKTRLAAVLSPQARLELARSMLAAVLTAALHAKSIRQVLVISPERDGLPSGIPVLADNGSSLNGALAQAHSVVRELGGMDVVVLPADLPTVSAEEIDALVTAGRTGGFAIAPDAAGTGTNALCLAAATPFCYQFGSRSCQAHLQQAALLGLGAQVVFRPGLAFDVDSPADLRKLEAFSCDTPLRA